MAVATSCLFYFESCSQSTRCKKIFSPEMNYKAIQKECKGNKDNTQQNNVFQAFKRKHCQCLNVCRYRYRYTHYKYAHTYIHPHCIVYVF